MKRVLVAAALCACTNHDVVVADVGRACVYPWPVDLPTSAGIVEIEQRDPRNFDAASPQQFAADRPVFAVVTLWRGVSCTTDLDAGCSVARSGRTLRITSHAAWNEPDLCTREVHQIVVACRSAGVLDPGSYDLELAGARTERDPEHDRDHAVRRRTLTQVASSHTPIITAQPTITTSEPHTT